MDEHEKQFWIRLSLGGGLVLAIVGTGLLALVEERYVSGVGLTITGIVGTLAVWWMSKGLPMSGFRGLMILVACTVITWLFFGYDIYDRHHATASPTAISTPISTRPTTQRDMSRQQFSNLVSDLMGQQGTSVTIWVQPDDPEAMNYAVKLAEMLRRAHWKIRDGDPRKYDYVSELTPGLVVSHHDYDPRWQALLEHACAAGIQIDGRHPTVGEELKETDMVFWVGRNPAVAK